MTKRPCLLLVDDTPANIDILVGLLKDDYALKIANRGDKALKICEASDVVDLILLDVMMPGMDGFEVCRLLRQRPATADVPILFLTARTDVDDVVRGFDVGGTDYIAKPFRSAELLARVRTQLTLRAQQREIAEKNEKLKELIHVLCHDVANQFAVLQMSFELFERGPEDPSGEVLRCMKAAIRNGVQVTQMVREMRRSEDKAIKIQPVPLKGTFDECLLLIQPKLRNKQVRVELNVPDFLVLAEPCALVNSVFMNILTNAVKFSHPGGWVEIRAETDGDRARVTITDHGVGMSAGVLAKMFDLGASHSRAGTDGERGTGFGMPLMRRFVEQFGGTVEVASRDRNSCPENPGTEISVLLRLAKPRLS